MRSFAFFCCAAVLVGCARPDDEVATDTAAAAVEAPGTVGAGRISLADVAGKWTVRATNEAGDSLVSYQVVATDNISGWTMHLPNRPPIPMRVTYGGDSIIAQAGPYESVLRKGVQVIVHSVSRLQDDKLVGTFVAGYSTTGPDSVLRGRLEGTRAP